MSTAETTRAFEDGDGREALPETMPSVEPLQMSQIDMMKIAPTRDERLFLVLSIFIGIISGLLVVSFRIAINWVQALTLGSAPQPGLLRLIFVPVIMGAVVAALVQLCLSGGARQRGEPDQGRALHLQRLHLVQDGDRQVHHLGAGGGRRLLAGTRGSGDADRRGRGFGDQPQAGNEPATAAALRSGRRGCGTGGGVQRADLGDPVRH